MDNVVAESKDRMINELNFDYQRQVNTSQTGGKYIPFLPVQTFMRQMRETKTLDFTLAVMLIPIWVYVV